MHPSWTDVQVGFQPFPVDRMAPPPNSARNNGKSRSGPMRACALTSAIGSGISWRDTLAPVQSNENGAGSFPVSQGGAPMPNNVARKVETATEYEVEVAERKDSPGAWTVEAIDMDGGIEQAIFAGPKARERAEAYAAFQYGR
jgi:hypothetical protein